MNEDFIKQFKRLPDANLVEKIQARLERKERRQTMRRYSLLSAFALIFVFGVFITVSSPARAYVLQTIEEIAGLKFEITSGYPGVPGEQVHTAPSEQLSLEEAQSRFPAPISLPTYVPAGYARQEPLSLTTFEKPDLPLYTTIFLDIHWENKNGGAFMLNIRHCPGGLEYCGWIVGEAAIEEITLNGRPAVIVRGGWNDDTRQYDFSLPTAIEWKVDESTIYSLTGNQSLEELIRIAESIP
jgi:hypothetical protein